MKTFLKAVALILLPLLALAQSAPPSGSSGSGGSGGGSGSPFGDIIAASYGLNSEPATTTGMTYATGGGGVLQLHSPSFQLTTNATNLMLLGSATGNVFSDNIAAPTVSSVAHTFDTRATYPASSKLFSLKTLGVERLSINSSGGITAGSNIISGLDVYLGLSGNLRVAGQSSPISLIASKTDSSTTVGTTIDTNVAYVTAGAKILNLKNNGVEKLFMDKDGNIKLVDAWVSAPQGFGNGSLGAVQGVHFSGSNTFIVAAGDASKVGLTSNTGATFVEATMAGVEVKGTLSSGFILRSPDGTRYRIQVANGGALSTTVAAAAVVGDEFVPVVGSAAPPARRKKK